MPRVADGPGSLPEPARVGEAKGVAPVPNGLIRDDDAAVGEEVFDVAETEGKAVVQPDGLADDGGKESVARIADEVVEPSGYSGRGRLTLTMPSPPDQSQRIATSHFRTAF